MLGMRGPRGRLLPTGPAVADRLRHGPEDGTSLHAIRGRFGTAYPDRMRIAVLSVSAALLLGVLPATTAAAAPAQAQGSWSMVPQAKDANGDGFIDGDGGVPRSGALSRQPSAQFVGAGNRIAQPHERLIDGSLSWYLRESGFPVRLDACASTGTAYRWTIRSGGDRVLATEWRDLTPAQCRQVVTLPEDRYAFDLEVRGPGGIDTLAMTAEIRNLLVLALGDSYASGEGNPRNVRAWLRQPGPFAPYWDDDACHRSVRSAPAQAALRLEKSSEQTSVTFVDVSCSGATIDRGILGPQVSAAKAASQIEQAAAIVGSHPIDLVTISIGGNDVGFTSVLQACLLSSDCPLSRATSLPLSRYPSVQEGVQAETGRLSQQFSRIAACLGGDACTLAGGRSVPSLSLDERARVLPTLYPDITRAASGASCSYLTMSTQDFGWARSTMLDPRPPAVYPYPTASGTVARLPLPNGSLNEQVSSTRALPGWAPVTGTWTASGESAVGHGVCAGDEAWVFGAELLAGFSSASFHPNVTGTRVMGRAIAQAMVVATSP